MPHTGGMTQTTTPLAEQTPVEIDTELARLNGEIAKAEDAISRAVDRAHRTVGDTKNRFGGWEQDHEEVMRNLWRSAAQGSSRADDVIDDLATARTALQDRLREAGVLDNEFARRGGWTRAFLVAQSNGHVHKDRFCSTCFAGTQYYWVTDLSGADEDEIVAKAGERACTVCYPSAPVEVLSRPTQIFSDVERDQQAARAEREAKRQAADEAKVEVEGYSEYGSRAKIKVFKSVRAVTNAIASDLSSLCLYGVSHPDGASWLANIVACRAALKAKGVEYDYDKALATARKRVEKQVRSGHFGDPNFKAQY